MQAFLKTEGKKKVVDPETLKAEFCFEVDFNSDISFELIEFILAFQAHRTAVMPWQSVPWAIHVG